MMSSMGLGKSNKLPPCTSTFPKFTPCPSHDSFSIELSEPEQRLSQIRELIASMPKPNHDTLYHLLEHLCRSGKRNILFTQGEGGVGHAAGTSFEWGEGREIPKFRADG